MKLLRPALLMMIVLCCTSITYSQIEDMADETAGQKTEGEKDITFALHGYAQANFVVSRNDIGSKGNLWLNSRYEFPRAGATVQLEFEGNAYDKAHFFSAVQIEYNATGEKTNFPKFYWPNFLFPGLEYTYFQKYADYKRDEISKAPSINVREAYVDLYGKHVTFRAGQQIISWGEIEGIEAPSDIVIPWDFTTMSNYFEYSRIGVVAANLTFHFSKQQLQFIWIPLFQPTKLPLESLYNRGVTSITRPKFEVRNGEYAARLAGVIGNNLRYSLGFLYGFDDMPDTRIKIPMTYPVIGISTEVTEMYYNRVMMPAFDLNIGIGNVLSWKLSSSANFTKDIWNKKGSSKILTLPGYSSGFIYSSDNIKKSSVTYLTGPESTNLFAKIYVGLYLGQMWVIKYKEPGSMSLSKQISEGYGQQYQYKWMLSSNIQRSFLENDALDFQVRFALYTDPKLKKWDYVIYPYLMYKFTSGVSTAIGFIFADRLGDSRTMLIVETRYSF